MNQKVKRRNHEVPRGLLKNWISGSGDSSGHYYLNVPVDDERVRFEQGDAANFAITDYLYVPIVSGTVRDDSLEDWFAVDENGLAPFAKAAQNGDWSNLGNNKMMLQAIRACIALGFRCSYQFYSMGMMLEASSGNFEKGIHQGIIENARKLFALKFKQFCNWHFRVFYGLPGSLMINEQPFRDWTMRGVAMVTMPLGPNALLVGKPASDPSRRAMEIAIGPASDRLELVNMQNHVVIETARQWVVSIDENQLRSAAPSLTSMLVERRRMSDRSIAFDTSSPV
jgi:hypothetical protein